MYAEGGREGGLEVGGDARVAADWNCDDVGVVQETASVEGAADTCRAI
jgi:hypothetical protein